MRRFISFLVLLYFSGIAYSAPSYGTKMPQKGEVFTGGQTHSILKRNLEDSFGKVRSSQHFLLLSYGLTDWMSIDLNGGAGFIKQRPLGRDEIDYSSSFAGGYGFRVKLYEKNNYRIISGFQHISVHPKSTSLDGVENKAILDDWQVSLLNSYEYYKFNPYLGIKGSRVDYIHWIGDDRKRRMSDLTKPLGVVAGTDFFLTEKVWINLESQFIDGRALSLGINFKF